MFTKSDEVILSEIKHAKKKDNSTVKLLHGPFFPLKRHLQP